ncbi:amidohydrolase family protein [Maribacter halichondriae]|uniref:amidohydrolase family protein n=1 Tax=Maribacter halichondriae TaxID=2980554 RepID=UPI002358F4E6|nr:amidohydrolase family protein [Maribacter sp. Hal144]
MVIPRDDKQIRDTIAYWIKRGVRWFKVYRDTSPKDLETIIFEAHRHNAKVTGHLCSITFEEAANMGIDGIEHGLNSTSDFRNDKTYGICNGSREYIDTLDITRETVKDLIRLMVEKNVFMTSTLAIYESSISGRALADQRTLDAMAPFLVDQYKERRAQFNSLTSNDTIRENRLKRIMAFERRFFKMGGTLTAGVDPGRHVLPGYGDQRNFELLIEAGFTAEEAIKIMTKNGADVLSKTTIGSIAQGKRADFIILNGNLKENPTVIRNVDMVFKKGYGYDPKSILEEVRGKFGER